MYTYVTYSSIIEVCMLSQMMQLKLKVSKVKPFTTQACGQGQSEEHKIIAALFIIK